MNEFNEIQRLVVERAEELQQHQLFRVNPPVDIFEVYLSGFEDDATRQEHNCNACKQFIRNYGTLVAIQNGKLMTLWDFEVEGTFHKIPKLLRTLVLNSEVTSAFGTDSRRVGVEHNFQQLDGQSIKHLHFYFDVKKRITGETVDSYIGKLNTSRSMLKRALSELKVDAFETVLELITSNSIYRGSEFKSAVTIFYNLLQKYQTCSDKELFSWEHINSDAARFRNTAIGTLLVDLSDGVDLDAAVRSYEKKVAPENYKRPTAVVTPRMVEQAKEKIEELGLTTALERRYAKQSDISINDVLFANRNVTKTDIFGDIAKDLPVAERSLKVSKECTVDEFMSDIVPNSSSIELLVADRLSNNCVTLVAPVHDDAELLFNWDNNFSWSYGNGLTDSLKQRVKDAGGTVEGEVRISLEWFNYDDLDLHVVEPNGNKIYFSSKRSSYSGGQLDVDMNAGSGKSREPVENIIFPDKYTMLEGKYRVIVNNYNKRETTDVGFNVEIECRGEIHTINQSTSPNDSCSIEVATFKYSKENGLVLVNSLESKTKTISREVYGISTNKFYKVDMLLLSPNHWGSNKGNKHYFFVLEGMKADAPPRGIFNEFLKPELNDHRKVFEVLGNRIEVAHSDEQVNGIGFSETVKNHCIVKVDNKVFKINFGV
jgi:hypothetical protein